MTTHNKTFKTAMQGMARTFKKRRYASLFKIRLTITLYLKGKKMPSIIFGIILLLVVLLPTIIAIKKNYVHKNRVIIINLLLIISYNLFYKSYEQLGILLALTIFVLPTIIAIKKEHPQKTPIILTNILGGMIFGIGWLVSLVWCFITPNNKSSTSATHEIENLYKLLEKGILTQEEFNNKKEALLKI